jgi:rhamnosyltransferase
VFYDKDGIADEATLHYLRHLCEHVERLVVVVNGALTDAAREGFRAFTEEIVVRENTGLDAWAYKRGLEHVGWDALRGYDEALLVNDTVFGPVYPLSEMFGAMSDAGWDFWGASVHHGIPGKDFTGHNPYGYVPEHLQTYFIAYSARFLASKELEAYWRDLPEIRSHDAAVGLHETVFTKHFSDLGFRWAAYADLAERDRIDGSAIFYRADAMLQKQRYPFIKRKVFTLDYLYDRPTAGEVARRALSFAREETGYDTDLIWKWMLRTMEQYDIVKNLALTYVLPAAARMAGRSGAPGQRAAVILDIRDPAYRSLSEDYLGNVPDGVDVHILREGPAARHPLAIARDYDIVCYIGDEAFPFSKSVKARHSWHAKTMENLLGSRDYIENILLTFAENPRLGMLMSPPPIHGKYASAPGREWGRYYVATKAKCDGLRLDVPISRQKSPVAPLDGAFWFRPAALPAAPDGPEAFPADRKSLLLYPFIVQSKGFYPAYAVSDSYAAVELTNLGRYLRSLNILLKKYKIKRTKFVTTIDSMDRKFYGDEPLRIYIKRWVKKRLPGRRGRWK